MFRKGFFIVLSLMMITPLSWAEDFDDGIDYITLPQAVDTGHPDKVVVTEMFWYGCPHCFRFEPYIHRWKKTIPEGVVFEQVPSVLNPSWMQHARAFFALQVMGAVDKVHGPLMEAIHIQNKRLNSVDTLAEFVASLGVDEKQFREHFHSFPVDTMVRKSRQKEQKYQHTGVPTVIINGKYRTSASQAGSNSRMIKVMDYLIQQELAQK